MYKIEVVKGDGSVWHVERRYSELLGLHKALKAKYTYISVRIPVSPSLALHSVLDAEEAASSSLSRTNKNGQAGRIQREAAAAVAKQVASGASASASASSSSSGIPDSESANLFSLFPPKSVSPDLEGRTAGLDAYIRFVMANPSLCAEGEVKTMFGLDGSGQSGSEGRGAPADGYSSLPVEAKKKHKPVSSLRGQGLDVGSIRVPIGRESDDGKYIVYEIELYSPTELLAAEPVPSAVLLRRYSQFLLLHKALAAEFDRSESLPFMAPFPPKSGMGKASPDVVESRRLFFEALLQGALAHPLMSRSSHLAEFLDVGSAVHGNLDVFATVA